MRRVLRRALHVTALAALVASVPLSPATSGERQRAAAEDYTTTAVPGLDCATNEGGVCLDLAGDEFSVKLTVEDDEGWTDIPLHYAFVDATGATLSSGDLCSSGGATVPRGAAVLQATVGLVTAGTCSHPTVSQTGSVSAVFELKRNPKEIPADDERRCTGGLGEPASYALRPDDGRVVVVDALILVDGITDTLARETMAKVARGFAEIDITLKSTFLPVTLTPASLSVNHMFAAIKGSVGGLVPDGFELVHTLTNKDIASWAGYADCVGGIQSVTRAFSMSEVRGQTINIIGGVPSPVWFWGDDYLAAHEIGHLFGGGHDFANCVEGVAVVEGEVPAPCTLMHPNLNVSYKFSTINRAIVRGHALDFASP